MQIVDELGKRLQIIRKLHKCSQAEIANVLQTTQQQYWKYENNKQDLPIRHLITLAKYYDMTTDELLGIKDTFEKVREKEEAEVIRMYRILDEREKGRILERMQMLILSTDSIYGGLNIKRNEDEKNV